MGYPNRRRHTDTSSHNLEGRVSAVETAVEHIEVGMIDIRDSIRAGFMELRGELDIQNESTRPKIAAWAGWAAVVVIVIGMFGSGYIRDLNRLERDQNAFIDNTIKHRIEDSAAMAVNATKIHALEREVFIKEVIVNGRKKSKSEN